MYLKHFGLREFPFSITPDTAFAFGSRSHQRALNVLLVAQRHGEGFIKVVGEVGTGKTLLCRRVLSCLPAGTADGDRTHRRVHPMAADACAGACDRGCVGQAARPAAGHAGVGAAGGGGTRCLTYPDQ